MPRQVDHDQRRAQITDAVLRIAAHRGLGEVTMTEVATEAGVSRGRIQHYFGSKEQLLLHTGRRLRDRVTARLLPDPPTGDPRRTLTLLLHATLPATEQARVDALAGKALFTVALGIPELRDQYRQGITGLHTLIADLLVHAGADPDRAPLRARTLLGLAEHLGDALLIDEVTAARARDLLTDQVAASLP
ncbi:MULTISPECIES: TetR/AcrR family transcriptional regulator [unclassified Nocardiopsis]|uniref:TetR/AcrR family transcriptional regulator n=1 Tax=Nocardiopsis TaxID=2013 RepID=UPI00387AA835